LNIMKKAKIINKVFFLLVLMVITSLLFACNSPAPIVPSPDDPVSSPTDTSETVTPAKDSEVLPDRVEIIYFHRPARCVTCICFEERISYVIDSNFQDVLNNGKLTFNIYELGDENSEALARKYVAVGSQLFINTIKDGNDNIRDIQEIWSWNCTKDESAFDENVKNVIEQSLKGEG